MKRFTNLFFVASLVTLISFSCGTSKKAAKTTQSTPVISQHDSLAYAIGRDIGANFEKSKLDSLNPDLISLGIKHHFSKDTSVMSDDDMLHVMEEFGKRRQAEMEEQRKIDEAKTEAENKAKYGVTMESNKKFFQQNKQKPGVIETVSGLQYKVLTEGTGAIPISSDKVTVHYTGVLLDGTKFDSSVDRGQPASFPVSGVIKGWTEVLQLMKTGAKYEVYIPSELAYGARGAGEVIQPYSALIFTVELISIDK